MTSPNLNIQNVSAYPVMAPVSNSSTDGGWIWKGGKNYITSSYNDNVYFDNGNILLDWGQNCFLKGANKNHLIGGIDEPDPYSYMVRNNDFNNSNIPVSSLYYYYNINQQVTPYYQGSNFICNSTDLGTVWLINDLGNGIYDTVFKSNNTSGYQPQPDEANYSSATVKMAQSQYFDAISYFKALINNYPSSSYTDACLYDLYECYVNLDTSGNQSIRDILFNDLRNYLNSKILSGLYSSEFNNIAYNLTVMCEAYIGDYNEALEGYEFISLYHPDMYIRLLASWDYAEILELLNGPGGISGKEENMTDKEYVSHITKRINKLIAEDPVKKKMKKSFLRMKEDRETAIEKDILTKTGNGKATKTTLAKLQKDEQKLEDRVIKVLRYAGTMSEEEKRKQQMEDILLSRYNGNNSADVVENKIPGSYELSQNYPNPFNPTTTIKYALPKDGFVTLKIYDITGREVKVLINEVKKTGYYSVNF
ncbi:MAG: hypothetical protein L0Y76_09310, partial [Ignavibacteria bacterium]|nr:hypothetical protein [Ignavibacteria bacterium]